MTDRDNITLPRKHIDYAAHALEHFNKDAPDPLVSEIIHHLRTHLAAPKQEPEPGLMELARQMKPLDADMAAILHDNLDSLYIEDEPALAAEQPVAKAWAEGYQQGVKDERTSEASIGIAGFGAKVEPARQNPYGTALAAEQPKPSGYAYRYSDGALRFNNGKPVNGGSPVEAVPYWFAPPDAEALRRDAEKWRKAQAKYIAWQKGGKAEAMEGT